MIAKLHRLWRVYVSLVLVAAIALVVVPAQPSSAYLLLGQKWSTSSIKYYAASPLSSYSTWTAAAGQWSGLDGTLTLSGSSPHIYARQENRGNTVAWTGVTRKPGTVQGYPAYSGSYWISGMEVVLNWSLITSLGYTSSQKKMVAAHEFGHAYGLAHNSATLPGTPGVPTALMYPYDSTRIYYGVLTPQADDKAGVNALY